MNLSMARLTKRHEVTPYVLTALINGNDMVDFFDGDDPSFLCTAFTDRMMRYIESSQLSPLIVICFLTLRRSLIFVILSAVLSLMFGTILLIREIRAAGMTTRLFRLIRHKYHQITQRAQAVKLKLSV